MAVDYAGLKYDVYYGDSDGSNFKNILGVSNAEFDNSSDEVTRNFLDGTGLKLKTNFQSAMNITITDIGQDNFENIVPGYVYQPGDEIDGYEGVTVGPGGAVSVGVENSGTIQVPGILKLVPKLANQSNHTMYMLDAVSSISDTSLDDGLQEYVISVSGRLIKGDLTFATS